ncbi:MAG TPA: HAMP domain-containing sensor histidine kinase [Kofleriaceae bacterium]|nr:HAMP domain-containing sensor histidine kinase [Kofleriaceae bacterium]
MRAWLVALIAGCVGVPVVVATRVLAHDRDAAIDAFARDKLVELTESAQDLGGNLARVGDDLAFAARVAEPADASATAELDAVASVKHAYLTIDVAPRLGVRLHAGAAMPNAAPVIDQMLAAAARAPGELQISAGLSSANDEAAWYRVFARQEPNGAAAAAVVDMRQVVVLPRLLRVGSQRLLVMSAHGVPAPISDPAMTSLADPLLAGLVARAVARVPSTVQLDASSAVALGLPNVDAIAAAVPVPIDRGAPWVLALVASTESLEARHSALARRMAFGGVLGLALLALATAYVVRTARREAELRERLRAEERLLRTEKLATAGQLSAGIAHEIGTPLGVVRGRAELAIGRLGADHAETPGLRVIVDQIDHVTRLIAQLLSYARPDATNAQPLDVRSAIDSAVELLAAEASRKQVALDRGDVAGSVFADAGQLQQVLVNVAMNAIDACSEGGRVTLSAQPRGDAIAIEIADTGHGISADDRAHLFDPFFTRKKRGKGTGLGLWVVAELARAHFAEIEISSVEGRGTTFRILWPTERRTA